MDIVFDVAKDTANIAKHGFSMAMAVAIEWETAVMWPDQRMAYGEPRMIGLGYIGLRLFVAVFVDRGNTRRIISLRRANRREIKRYADT